MTEKPNEITVVKIAISPNYFAEMTLCPVVGEIAC